MQIVFTTNQKIGSRIIRWVTDEPVSHVAIFWQGLVIHSNYMHGVHIQKQSDFLQENEVIYSVELPDDSNKIIALLQKSVTERYDIPALLFVGLILLFRRIFHVKSHLKVNLWQTTGLYICTELVSEYLYGKEDAMLTPYKLYLRLINRSN